MLTKADKWLIAVILIVSVAGIGLGFYLFPASGAMEAQVSVNGVLVKTIPLKQGYYDELRIGADKEYDIIEVNNGRIRIREADCPDKLCVRSGWISTAPQQIVCLPNRVIIKIIPTQLPDIDDITR